MKKLILGMLILGILFACAAKGVYVGKTEIDGRMIMVSQTSSEVKEAWGAPKDIKTYNKPRDAYSLAGTWKVWIYDGVHVYISEADVVVRIVEFRK